MSNRTKYLQLLGSFPSGAGLPPVNADDNGKFMQVRNGEWVAENLPMYDGAYTVVPSANHDQILETTQLLMDSDVKVEKIPYSEVSNTSGGKTVTIG